MSSVNAGGELWLETPRFPRLLRFAAWIGLYCDRAHHWVPFRRTKRMVSLITDNPRPQTWCIPCKVLQDLVK